MSVIYMASRKRKASTSRPQEPYDTSRFVFEVAWERYEQNMHNQNILPERNVELTFSHYDEYLRELERCRWHRALNRQCKVRGKLIKFDVATLNEFLETPVVLELEERMRIYAECRGGPMEAAQEGPYLTTLAQTWSVISYSSLAPTSHTSDLSMDKVRLVYGLVMKMDIDVGPIISSQISQMAQSNSSRLGFPTLITALCIARGVVSDSLTFESLSPASNLAYIRKNCWNPDDLIITFLGSRKARARAPSYASTSAPAPTLALVLAPAPSAPFGPSMQSSNVVVPML
ncbi:hypothetical protein HKD37_07G018910 [Glycine soja]